MASIHDELFDALSNDQRRQILFSLVEQPQSIHIDSPPDTLRDSRRERIERQHVHLPKLADHGFIEWSSSMGVVEEGPRFEEVKPLLQLLAENREAFPVASM